MRARAGLFVGCRWHRWYDCWHGISFRSAMPARGRHAERHAYSQRQAARARLQTLRLRWALPACLQQRQQVVALRLPLRWEAEADRAWCLPAGDLGGARDHREASRKLLANRKDPSVERRLEKIARQAGGNNSARLPRSSSTSKGVRSGVRPRCARNGGCSNRPTRPSAIARSARSLRLSSCMRCGNLNCEGATKAHAGCARSPA